MLVSILFPLFFYNCNENKLKINIPPYGENLMLTYWDKNWNLEGLHYLSILPLRNNWMDFRFSENKGCMMGRCTDTSCFSKSVGISDKANHRSYIIWTGKNKDTAQTAELNTLISGFVVRLWHKKFSSWRGSLLMPFQEKTPPIQCYTFPGRHLIVIVRPISVCLRFV